MHKKNTTLILTTNAVIAALYAALTIALAPISYGAVQFRVSEALTILPFFIPGTVWGLYVGCILSNLFTGNVFDIVFGSLATLLAGLLTARFGRGGNTVKNRLLACLMPVVFNAVIVGAVITWAYEGQNIFEHHGLYALNAAWVGLGEAGVLYLIGYTLMKHLPKLKFFREFVEKCKE
jgi:uncharacterized membrane protein